MVTPTEEKPTLYLYYSIDSPAVEDGVTEPDTAGHCWRKLKPLPTGDVLLHVWGVCHKDVAHAILQLVYKNNEDEKTRDDHAARLVAIEAALGYPLTPPEGLDGQASS